MQIHLLLLCLTENGKFEHFVCREQDYNEASFCREKERSLKMLTVGQKRGRNFGSELTATPTNIFKRFAFVCLEMLNF